MYVHRTFNINILCNFSRFIFDDHIRCMAAKQRLTKGRLKARQRKMQMIARLLELPPHIVDSMYTPSGITHSAATLRARASASGASSSTAYPGMPVQVSYYLQYTPCSRTGSPRCLLAAGWRRSSIRMQISRAFCTYTTCVRVVY